jgi:hypothetical protein
VNLFFCAPSRESTGTIAEANPAGPRSSFRWYSNNIDDFYSLKIKRRQLQSNMKKKEPGDEKPDPVFIENQSG